MDALRGSLSSTRPAYDGRFYRYGGVVVDPCAVQPHVPIWVGGRTMRSLRRAVRSADGWMPFGLTVAQLCGMLSRVEVPAGFEVVLATGRSVDPLAEPVATAARLATLRDAGATVITCSVSADSADHYVEQLAALRDIADRLEGEAG